MSWLQDFWAAFAELLQTVLPRSPFVDFIASFQGLPGLGWLNWFIPVGSILTVMAAWLGAVGLFYLYSIIMRWLKVIGD